MSKKKPPVTAAIRVLRQHKASYQEYLYDYQEKGGTHYGAQSLGIAETLLIKTLIMEDEQKNPIIVLMHGDRQVSTKALARILAVKSITPCDPDIANKHSGYQIGGTSPFGTRRTMPVYMESSILALDEIYINGGKRGLLLRMNSKEVQDILQATLVEVATS